MDKTEIKQDADFIANRLVTIADQIENHTVGLKRQANKLFGDQPESDETRINPSRDEMPVLDLLNVIETALENLGAQVYRF